MGGVSEGRVSVRPGPEGPYVRLEGLVSTANNGGFIQIRTKIADGVKDAEGILLKVRGNGENYYIHLNTNTHTNKNTSTSTSTSTNTNTNTNTKRKRKQIRIRI